MTIDERIEFLMQSTESHDRQIGELTAQIGEMSVQVSAMSVQVSAMTSAINKLVAVTNEDASAIRTLARIAEAHENRISRLKGDH